MIMVTNNDASKLLISGRNPNNHQEKPRHLKYLNEFRTQQCLFFLDQQCQFHRPYTCFDWHFPNQKRRRPFKRPDGTFNYNPDVYCDKYDETSGSCVDGDDCPYAHRNAGDTERRYHPRYFKTGNCIYETTENGACVKNGLHCAFAHGPDDIRLPVYDIREVQDASSKFTVNLPASLEKERVLSEDPKWNEMFHVLACYKTELCKKPPRMCRQGYSCPFYHNGKDKRRAPDKWRYRSTPCPIVRPGDEWLDSGLCEAGDTCTYCHTRTEQQFHPEIYKSTKCNDVINSGYCPRGPFCAFAHCDSEISTGRDFLAKLQQEQLSSTNGMGLGETSPRGAQLPSGFVVPNLMSPLTNLSGPALITAPGTNRGRRVGRCSSPHQNLGMWQPTVSGTDRAYSFMGASSVTTTTAMTTSTVNLNSPTSCGTINNNNNNTNNNGFMTSNIPKDTAQLAANAMLSLAQTAATPTAGHVPFYQHRPMSSLFQNVITNSMALNAAARDKGRHRSGSSVSSSDGGLFSFNHSDLTSSPSVTRPLGPSVNPCTPYLGRGTMVPGPQSFGPSLRTVHSGGKTQPTRTANKKLTGSIAPPLQQQSACGTLGATSFFTDRSASLGADTVISDSTSTGQSIRGLTASDSTRSSKENARPIGSHLSQHQPTVPVPLLQNSLWPVESVPADRLLASNWPWHVTLDSGHNSETSIPDPSELPQGLYDLSATTGGSGAGAGGNSTGPFGQGPHGLGSSSQRDSGLVMDFTLPAMGERSSDSSLIGTTHPAGGRYRPSRSVRDQFAAIDDPDNQMSPESLQDLIGKSESFLQQLHSTPNRARSGTATDYSQRLCLSFLPDLCGDSSDSVSRTASSTQPIPHSSEPQIPGFHSPLDDILLQSQSYAALQADSSPGFDSGLSGSSDPMSIPGRGTQPRERSGLHITSGSHRCVSHQSGTRQGQCVHNQDSEITSGSRPASSGRGVATQQNTWPIIYDQTPVSTGSRSNFPSPVPTSSQTSHSFSPAVGTPANTRFTSPYPIARNHVHQLPPSFASSASTAGIAPPPSLQPLRTPAQTALDLNQGTSVGSGNGAPPIFSKNSTEQSDLSELPRTPSLVKIETSSDSSCSDSVQLQTDNARMRFDSQTAMMLSNGNYPNWPQSPILMSSPFNNPGYELERLSLQRELDEVRQRLDSKEDELEIIKRQRDFVAEHLRDSLGVIQKLFSSFHVSPPDLSRPLYVDTDHPGTGSDPSTGCSVTGLTASEVSPMPEEDDPTGAEHSQHMPTVSNELIPPTTQQSPNNATNEVLLDRRQLQQQQEALAALFANPFVSALLNSNGSGLDSIVGHGADPNSIPLWSCANTTFLGQEKNSGHPPSCADFDASNTTAVAGVDKSGSVSTDSKVQPISDNLDDVPSTAPGSSP